MALAFTDPDLGGPAKWGGTTDKIDHDVEGTTPHAWGFYRALQTAQGAAFSKLREGYLHAENLSEARALAGVMRAAEKLFTNSFPSQSDELLAYWVDVFGIIVYPDDTDDDVRAKCQARFVTWIGNDATHINAAIRTLLRDLFQEVVRFTGDDIDTPPTRTYWPGVNPGPTTFNLGDNDGSTLDLHGDGAWYSDHSRILVLAKNDTAIHVKKVRRLLNVELNDLLSRRLPAFTSWSWAFSSTFTLGDSGLSEAAVE